MNWQKLIADLYRWGLSQGDIARRAGISVPYVSQLAHGHKDALSFEKGMALRRLHERERDKRRASRA